MALDSYAHPADCKHLIDLGVGTRLTHLQSTTTENKICRRAPLPTAPNGGNPPHNSGLSWRAWACQQTYQ